MVRLAAGLALALVACGETPTAPRATPVATPAANVIVWTAGCSGVWGLDLDGKRLGLWFVAGPGIMRQDTVTAGSHTVQYFLWAANVSGRAVLDVQGPTVYKMTCVTPTPAAEPSP